MPFGAVPVKQLILPMVAIMGRTFSQCRTKAFPLRGRRHGKAVTDEVYRAATSLIAACVFAFCNYPLQKRYFVFLWPNKHKIREEKTLYKVHKINNKISYKKTKEFLDIQGDF